MRKLDFATFNRSRTPFHNTQASIHRRRRSHGHRTSRKSRQFKNTSSKDLIKRLLYLCSKSRRCLYVVLKELSLKDGIRINECLGLYNGNSDYIIPDDFRVII